MTELQKPREELAYALITPYSLHKSRTGGILARLLWADVKLVAARMYAPSPESRFIEEYCDAIYDPEERHISLRFQRMLIEYAVENFGVPNARGISNRLTLLVFRGPDAQQEITDAVGHLSQHVQGDNIRGTFGEFFTENPAAVERGPAYLDRKRLLGKYAALIKAELRARHNNFFEPAVLCGASPQMCEAHLKIFRKYAYTDGGFVLHAIEGLDVPTTETSLVVLKPESFRHRNPLPGNLIDFFARTGMFITGMKVMELGVEEARKFYALKTAQFREQLKGMVAKRARQIVRQAKILAQDAADRLGTDRGAALEPDRALGAAEKAEELLGKEPGPGDVKRQVVKRIFSELRDRLQNLDPPDSVYDQLAEELKEENARAEFDELIRYMTGKDPATGQPLSAQEASRCMVLLYSGPEALSVIRKRLKELREVYGQNLLQNRAHASDPDEDPAKELRVLGMPAASGMESRPCDVERMVNEFYGPD